MKRILCASALLTLCWTTATAQMTIGDIRIEKNGDRADIRFSGHVDPQATRRNYKLILTPVLSNGKESVALPPIVVETRRTRILDKRDKTVPEPGAVLTENGASFDYAAQTDYREWLPGAAVRLDKTSAGCCSAHAFPPLFVSENVRIQDADTLHIPIDDKEQLLVKNRSLPQRKDTTVRATAERLARLSLDFPVNSAELAPDLNDNRRMLAELVSVLQTAVESPGIRINITGYASPEGPVGFNNELAIQRARSVSEYATSRLPQLSPSAVRLVRGGENWTGLREAVAQSDMPGKEKALYIIDNVPAEIDYARNTSRKKQLMELDGGRVWRRMQAEFFPRLRNAVSVTLYRTTREVHLSVFPQDADSNSTLVNLAIELIGNGRTGQALETLLPIGDDPRAWNPIGVCYLLKGDREEARAYLVKAAEAGYGEAAKNLEQCFQ
ncbi:MAG: hypothetical protein LIO68_02495 [Rikenellaceae bacterium]|nr:hypothetical protein [Rikenellaceae bacterium]